MNKQSAPRVFISYSHDSGEHSDRVLAFAQQLRRDGIDAELDQFHQNELVHWPRWCEEQMRPEKSDFVLAVCTPEYRLRIEGRVPADVGKGVFWEGTLLYNNLYDAKGNIRFIPVSFDDSQVNAIPNVLNGYSRYRVEPMGLADANSGYAQLYRLLTGQGSSLRNELGTLNHLPALMPRERRTDFIDLIETIHAKVDTIQSQQDVESEKSKRRFKVLVMVLIITAASGYGIYRLTRNTQIITESSHQHTQKQQETQTLLRDTRARLEDVIAAVGKQPRTGEPLTPQQRYEQALTEVAFKHNLTPAELRTAIDAWTAKVKTDPKASPYDLALAEYKSNHFEKAAEQAGIAYDQAMQNRTQATAEAVKSARLEGDAQFAAVHYEQALAAYRKAAALTDKTSDPIAWAEAQALVALPLYTMARYTEAEPLLREIMNIQEASFGKDHPNVAVALNNLASLLQDTNRLAEAEPLMKRALTIDEASFGKDHPNVAIRLNNLASLLQDTNRLAEAEPLMKRALTIDEASFGKDHPNVAVALNNLASLLQATNRLVEAEPLMKRALTIDEASFGQDHPKVALDLNNLASLLKATNRLAEAEPLMKRTLSIDEASFGKDHPKVATDLNNLAQLLQATNRLAEAEPLMKRALTIDEASFGKDHPNVAVALNNLASLLQATNRLVEADPLMKRALTIDEASFGQDHPKVALDLNNLASLLKATNRLVEAEPLMKRALSIDEASFGKDHPNVARDLNNLAQLFQDTNRLAEAEPLMKRALTIDEASFGKDHPNVAVALNNLAALLFQDTNRLAEAEPLMKRALSIDEASFGQDHPKVAIRLNNLAQLLQDTNRLAEAKPLSHRALVIFLRFQANTGHPHPHFETTHNNYIELLQAMGQSELQINAEMIKLQTELQKSSQRP